MKQTTAANAVKHGLASFHHVPKGREDELPPIERELIASRQPQSPEELEVVRELAFAMWQKGEHDRLLVAEAEKLCEKAGELFDKQARETYEKLKADWEKNPVEHHQALAQTPEGAGLFARIWVSLAKALVDNTCLSISMITQAIRADRENSSPLAIQGNGRWLMVRFLGLINDPNEYVEQWIAYEGLKPSVDVLGRTDKIIMDIPKEDSLLQELYDRADERLQQWFALNKELVSIQAEEREAFIEQYRETVMISDEFEVVLKRFHRYRVFAENRVKDANRRLANLKAAAERKAQKAEDREFRKVNQRIAIAKLDTEAFERFQNLQALAKMEEEFEAEVESGTDNYNLEPSQEISETIDPAVTEKDPESDPPQEPPIIKVPSDWRSEPAILSKITPNMAMFSEWTDEELDDSNDFIEQIAEITDKNTEWKQQVMACQIVETTRRHLQRQDKKRA